MLQYTLFFLIHTAWLTSCLRDFILSSHCLKKSTVTGSFYPITSDTFAAIHHMTVGLVPSLLVIGEDFAALGYMWKSWSGHPHLNAEPAQGQGYDTCLQATHMFVHFIFT